MKKKRSRTTRPNRPPRPPIERVVGAVLMRPRIALAGLFVLGFGFTLALLSYDPADPPDPAVLPAHALPTNLLGVPGAWLAQTLISGLGQTAYLALGVWFAVLLIVLQRRPIGMKFIRITGWTLLIPCAAAWATYLAMPAASFS